MDAISVQNLRREYKTYDKSAGVFGALKSLVYRPKRSIVAVDDISFTIPQGEVVGFVGPNGSGKTTTLKMLSGVLTPTSGECRVLGYRPDKRKRDYKRQISLVMGQKTQLIWDLPAVDTFKLHRDLYEIEDKFWKGTMNTLVELLDVGHVLDMPVRQLSLGERMKCELIVALLHEPKVLFLDEPTIGLDARAQRHLREFLHAYQKANNTTMLVTSHYTQDIANLCPRVIVIKKGNIIYDGEYSRLVAISEAEKRVLLRFRDKMTKESMDKLRAISQQSIIEKVDSHTYRLDIKSSDFNGVIENVFRSFPLEYFQAEEADLIRLFDPEFNLVLNEQKKD